VGKDFGAPGAFIAQTTALGSTMPGHHVFNGRIEGKRRLNLREAQNGYSSRPCTESLPSRNSPQRILPCLVAFAVISLLTASSVSVVFSQTSASPNVPSPKVLSSPNYQTGGNFGSSVASHGNIMVVAADYETVNGYYRAGRVYVYDSMTGSLLRTLISPKLQTDDYFGTFLALGNGTVAIGTNETVDGYVGAGSVYLFNVTSGALIREFTSPHPQTNGGFSYPYLIVNGTLVMGSNESTNGIPGAGILYLFSITSGNLLDNLTSPNPTRGGTFGNEAAIVGHTIIVGAYYENVANGAFGANGITHAGRVYIFSLPSNTLVRTLVSPNPQFNGEFGDFVLALSDDRVAVAAQSEAACSASLGECEGRVYIFNITTGALLSTISNPDNFQYGEFGWDIATSGDSLVVGAPWDGGATSTGSVGSNTFSGNAYVFSVTTGKPVLNLTSPTAQANGNFGWSVALSDNILVVSAQGEAVGGDGGAGQVYVYDLANVNNSTSTTTSSTTSSTTSVSSSSTQSLTSTSTSASSTAGGGIPEFPYQSLAAVVLTIGVVGSYLLTTRNRYRRAS
jgi:hypothetical protein